MRKKQQFYFSFFPNEWLVGTIHMTNSQRGLYINLLSIQSQKGELTYETILKQSEGIIEDVEVVLQNFVKNKRGNYYNEKMKSIQVDIKSKIEANSRGGKKSQEVQRQNRQNKHGGTEVTSEVSSEDSLNNARLTNEDMESIRLSNKSIDDQTLKSVEDWLDLPTSVE